MKNLWSKFGNGFGNAPVFIVYLIFINQHIRLNRSIITVYGHGKYFKILIFKLVLIKIVFQIFDYGHVKDFF